MAKGKRLTQRELGFTHGAICCASWLVSAHGEDSMAMEMIRNTISYEDVEKYGDEFDLKILMPLINMEREHEAFRESVDHQAS